MTPVKAGDQVNVHYRGTLDDGAEFDSSAGREPLSFTVGRGQVIEGFDAALIGMLPGDERTVRIPSEEAYGAYDETLVSTVSRSTFPPDLKLAVGVILRSRNPNAEFSRATVISLDDQDVTLDANHPLAGKALTFAIRLVSIG